MLLEIFTTLLTDAQSEIPALKKVAHYKDEFNNEQWNPVFPCAFFRYDGTKPVETSRASDGSALKSKILISVFIGDKDLDSPVTLNTVEQIENLFNDNQLSVVINSITYSFPVRLTQNGSDFVTYVKGLSVYRVHIEIEVPTGVMPESDIELPGAVTLLAPANAANDVDAAHANLSYDDLPDVLDYEIMIGDLGFENVLFHVTYYEYLNITLPDGIIEPLNTYYWKVRARNIAGYGAWSTVRSFTTINTPVVIPDYRTNQIIEWDGDKLVTSDANGIAAWLDTIAGINAAQSTNGNKPPYITNYVNGKNCILFNNNNHILSFTEQTFTNYTVIIVYKPIAQTAGDGNVLMGGSAGDIYQSLGLLNVGFGVGDGTRVRASAFNAADINAWKIRTFQKNKVYDGLNEITYAIAQTPTTIKLANIGKRNSSVFPAKAYIAYIGIYNAELNLTQYTQKYNFLNNKYNIYP